MRDVDAARKTAQNRHSKNLVLAEGEPVRERSVFRERHGNHVAGRTRHGGKGGAVTAFKLLQTLGKFLVDNPID